MKIETRAWIPEYYDDDDRPQNWMMIYDLAFEDFEPIDDLLAGVENLMLCTGLIDKNGRKIYEHDIIKIDDEYFENNWTQEPRWRLAVVWWDDELPSFHVGNIAEANVILRRDFAKKYYEVTGNIYENPELLEQTAV